MNIQQLRYLVAVNDLGSVSAAARSLGVTQPVISRALRAFEAQNGVTVFRLSGRCLVSTEAGKAVVDAARDALVAIDAVTQVAQSKGDQAELVIATTPTNGLLLTPALGELGRSDHALDIVVCRVDGADGVLQRVHGGEAEIGFSELSPVVSEGQLRVQPVAEVEVVLVSPVGTDLPHRVSWDDVVTQTLIAPRSGSERRELINDMAFRTAGTIPTSALVLEDRGSWIAAVQAGMGSCLTYRTLVSEQPRIEIRSFEPTQTVTVGFMYRNETLSRAATRLVSLASASLNASPDD